MNKDHHQKFLLLIGPNTIFDQKDMFYIFHLTEQYQ